MKNRASNKCVTLLVYQIGTPEEKGTENITEETMKFFLFIVKFNCKTLYISKASANSK